MDKSKRLAWMIIGLGALAFIAMGFAGLALTDIARGTEPDLDMEWGIVKLSFLLNLMFIALALILTWQFLQDKD